MSGLIQPARAGDALLTEITSENPGPGSLSVWWLGQSGYAIKSRSGLMVVDPYLSEHLTIKYAKTNKPHIRMTATPFRPHELTGVDLVLSSHKHSDHLDPDTIPDLLAVNSSATLVLPRSLIGHAANLGLDPDRIRGIEANQTLELAGFHIRAIPSAHEALDTDDAGHHLYLGFVIEAEGLRLYHSGDTMVYDGLIGNLGPNPFDVLFLPINGRDPKRDVAGNMSVAEAVDIATIMRPRYLVPHHYDMFTFNTVPVADFEREALRLPEGVTPKVLRCGERWEVGPWV